MTDNVLSIRAGVQPDSDPEREILIHLQEKLADMKANSISPTGIVFVIFGNNAEDKLFSSVHWMTSYMADQGSFAAAYAAMKIQAELFQ